MVKSRIDSLKETFNATGIAFNEQGQHFTTVDLDIRAVARKQEQTQQEKLDELDHNHAREIPVEGQTIGAPGRIATNQAHAMAQETIQQQKKDKELKEFIQRVQLQRHQWIDRLERLEQWYREQAGEKLREAEKHEQQVFSNIEKMQNNSTFIGEVNKLLQAHNAGEEFDREKLRRLLKEKGADVNDTTSLAILLKTAEKMVIEADEENAFLEAENNSHELVADELVQEAKQDIASADAVHEQLEGLKSQNLSDEVFEQKANEIWENVPYEEKKEYQTKYGEKLADKKVEHDYSEKMEQVEGFDPFAEQPENLTNNDKQELTNKLNSSAPSLGGM